MTEAYREMGLTDAEYGMIKELMQREPNYVETGIFAVMWSEHCGYKNSRELLRLFPNDAPWVLQGPGENAGVVDIGDGIAVVFKMESHNHPSAVEPFQGAATGIGGIVRDIFTMGARPIALLDPMRFGNPDEARVKYLFNGVVAGISFYGNCLGIPTVGGEVVFDDCYSGNPLVNVMAVGIMGHDEMAKGVASGVGNPVMLVGAKTGRDGIHGATFASEELNEESESKRPSVQVGDPFMEKLLLEACLEIIRADLVLGMQDLGAAGLTSSASEMASRGEGGIELDVSLIPRREENMSPYEVMLSESQERMLLVPRPGYEDRVREIFDKWGLDAVVIGKVTGDGQFRIKEGDEVAADIPIKALIDLCPVYHPERKEPDYLAETLNWSRGDLPEKYNCAESLLELLDHPTIASKEWVYHKYDYDVRTNTVVPPGSDAAVVRVKGSKKGIALTTDCNGRYCYLDPYKGGMQAVAEAARNLAASGARPLAITDCLNFGNPEKPEIYWQMEQSVKGLSEACRVLQTPVTGGNVSLYNETPKGAIFPTPVVGMVGVLEDVEKRITQAFKAESDVILLLGKNIGHLGGSLYLKQVLGREAGPPPDVNLQEEKALITFCLEAAEKGLLHSAHDCAEGGLAVALAECCISGGIGAEVKFSAAELRSDELLFAEDQGRMIISAKAGNEQRIQELAQKHGMPILVLGNTGGSEFLIEYGGENIVKLSLEEMEEKFRGAIPCRMD